eukprot:TRINITY_DN3118_c0_g2_i5.p1 TRINITY_DN3118_c0_g2~~TRINITY_DN3118_c0_g2_i5.p1  ORF type:complete len:388 (+),score=131.51 TRINITY_DN3118_c0_g2_i5:94-1257(+)
MMKAIFCRSFLMVAPLTALRRAMQAEINFASSLVSLADQDNDGKVSHAELAAVLGKLGDVDHVAAASFLDNNFGDMDADADGLLGHDEVLNLVLAFRGQQKAAAIIQDADTGGDGKASMLELMDFGQKAGAGSAAESTGFEKVVKGSFAKMDADGDGNLDAKEMSNLLEIVHGQAASHVLELADTSGDGKASLAELSSLASQIDGVADGELATFLHQQFGVMDADYDGNLDQSEISGLLQAFEASKGPGDAKDNVEDGDGPNYVHENDDPSWFDAGYDVGETDEPSEDEEDQPSDEEEDEDSADPQDDAADKAAEGAILERVMKEAEVKVGEMEDPEQILTEVENDPGLKDLAKKEGFDSTQVIEGLRQNYENILHEEEKKFNIKVN